LIEKDKNLFRDLSNNWSDDKKSSFSISQIRKKRINRKMPLPFLKWAGGKRQLIPQLKNYFPKKFNKYVEPFVGGGAVFFYLYREGFLKYKKAILIDINKEIINCYKVIKNNVIDLIESLKNHKNEKNYYYKVRDLDRNFETYNKMTTIEKASRIIYLNKCCYNGLYRVNSKGQFNVPFGRYKNPQFCDEENLIEVNKALKNVEIFHDSFENCLKFAEINDFIYLDPPYSPVSETANFTSYTKENFNVDSQEDLFQVFKNLDKQGCKLMLSNSYNDYIHELYKDYKIFTLQAKRAINCDPSKRGKISEVLVLNY